MIKIYDKLVRDNVLAILNREKKTYVYRVADEEEYPEYLKKKLQEEVAEFIENPCIEELADIAEVLEHLSFIVGASPGILGTTMREKSAEKGKFLKGYILESVNNEEQD
jgi:predicted house-cleaning noncanonical NTP pyrophosphatase (MazG superfamily)